MKAHEENMKPTLSASSFPSQFPDTPSVFLVLTLVSFPTAFQL